MASNVTADSLINFLAKYGIACKKQGKCSNPIRVEDELIEVSTDSESVKNWRIYESSGSIQSVSSLQETKDREHLIFLHSNATGVPPTIAAKHVDRFISKVQSIEPFYHQRNVTIRNTVNVPIVHGDVYEALEENLLPNVLTFQRFHFKIEEGCSAALASLIVIMQLYGHSGIQLTAKPFIEKFPQIVVVVLDDADIYSTVERVIDFLLSIPESMAKVDIWIQQSIRDKFNARFFEQSHKRLLNVRTSFSLLLTCPSPSFSIPQISEPPRIGLYYFRKNDELKSFLEKYSVIHHLSFWTENISLGIGFSKSIKNCNNFTINVFPESLSVTGYSSYPPIIRHVDALPKQDVVDEIINLLIQKRKAFEALSMSERLKKLANTLGPDTVSVSLEQIRKRISSHEELSNCLILKQKIPVNLLAINIRNMTDSMMDELMVYVGCLILQGCNVAFVMSEVMIWFFEYPKCFPIFLASIAELFFQS
ncbi:uncharacterized protein LOC141848804 isoform X2 [Brevipalpus obovatus]|uniref:uncharacterized protein LOC141848804 isoform X2 n=1 Tax=Brevipalpus obovatus TaxID=246614 RepID=UPI003D9EDD98